MDAGWGAFIVGVPVALATGAVVGWAAALHQRTPDLIEQGRQLAQAEYATAQSSRATRAAATRARRRQLEEDRRVAEAQDQISLALRSRERPAQILAREFGGDDHGT
jgi:hypothetical protein